MRSPLAMLRMTRFGGAGALLALLAAGIAPAGAAGKVEAVAAPALGASAPLAGNASVTSMGRALAEAAERGDMQAVRALLAQRASAIRGGKASGHGDANEALDVNAPSADGTPALHWVVRMQDHETARLLLKAGADANRPNRYGVRPLHIAIDNVDVKMIRLLLAAHADPSSADATGETCLIMAARAGNLDAVKALLEKHAAVDASDPEYHQTPLMVAARYGHADIARLLIARGANVNAQTRIGPTPKFRLLSSNSGSKGAGIIRGGWPERGERDPTPGAKTPLLYAAREGHIDVARLLLDAGADIEKADADGVTPLLMAILNGRIELAQMLIERGANVKVSDWYGQTPLWSAVDIRNLDVPGPTRDNGVDREAAFALIKTLLAHGADPNARTKEYPPQRRWITRLGSLSWVDFTGQTPFLRAALAGDVKTMRLLLEYHADPNIATFNGTTPLMAAAGVNWTVAQTYDEGPQALLEAVKLAQSLGNDVNATNDMGLAAIHGAANRGSDDIIRFLVEKGAKLDVADKQGRTPLVWARGVFLATHPPEAKPTTIALLEQLRGG
ncbi:MAG TPA: ankyrin repeat domain-containing protein [Steroidobacteraceae bacterium]|nr:ankyrin repeat domain-containing protein [Steroidobacteraceae bacterium]